MREIRSRRWPRLALYSAVLLMGSSASGAGSILARANTPAMARMSMRAKATMPLAHPAAARGTVVRLHQKVVRVSIHNFAFGPAQLEVSRGTRIVWTNTDSDPHTVTSDKGLWASEALDTGNQFARVFKKAGTFPYHCSIHPFMHGVIIVKK